MKVVSIVGMAGSGKSEVARCFQEKGFTTVRFGDVTDEEVEKRGLELNEKNEREVRELLVTAGQRRHRVPAAALALPAAAPAKSRPAARARRSAPPRRR